MAAATNKRGLKIDNVLSLRSNMKGFAGSIGSDVGNSKSGQILETVGVSSSIASDGITLVDSSSRNEMGENIVLRLQNTEVGKIKEIMLVSGNSDVTVKTYNGGFLISQEKPYLKLIFTNCGWKPVCKNSTCFPVEESCKLSSKKIITKTNAGIGSSVSLSADGLTLAVGAPGDDIQLGPIGAVFIYAFDKSSNRWVETDKIISEDFIYAMSAQGYSVSLSYDGNVLAIGGISDNKLNGAVWVYKREQPTELTPYGVWKKSNKIVARDCIGHSRQGTSVCLNADGTKLIFGGGGDNNNYGAVWVYDLIRMKSQKIVPSIIDDSLVLIQAQFNQIKGVGTCVSINAIGDKIAFTSSDILWVYSVDSEGKYVYRYHHVAEPNNSFGIGLAMNSEGNVIVVGAPYENKNVGCVYVFSVTSGEGDSPLWFYKIEKIKSLDYTGLNAKQGSSVSINGRGDVIAFGGCADDNFKGASWVYVYEGGKWLQIGKFVGRDLVKNSSGFIESGTSIAMNSSGSLIAVGNIADEGVGSVTIFN
jgi:hypothetical protein